MICARRSVATWVVLPSLPQFDNPSDTVAVRYTPDTAAGWAAILGLGLIFRFFGRSNEHARIAVWTEPLPAATRVTVSLVTGIFQAPAVHSTITELIDDLSAAGVLLQAGEPFSGIDLPANSPGQPFPRRRARQEARRR